MTAFKVSFSKNIVILLNKTLKRKLSREVLSSKLLLEEEIDISAQEITKIENNLRTVCDYELNGLSKVLNVEISVLVN